MSLYRRVCVCLLFALIWGPVLPAAGPSFDDCEQRVRDQPEDRSAWACFQMVALMHGSIDEAERRLDRYLDEDPANQHARLQYARIVWRRDPSRGEALTREAIAGFAGAGKSEPQIRGLQMLAAQLRRDGRLEDSGDALDRASGLAVELGQPELLATVRNSMGWWSIDAADYGRAWSLFQKVAEFAEPDGPPFLRASALAGLAEVSQASGRERDALQFLDRLISFNLDRGDRYHSSEAMARQAAISLSLLRTGAVEQQQVDGMAERALRTSIEAGNVRAEISSRIALAAVTDDLSEQERHLLRARELIAVPGGNPKARAAILRGLARVRFGQTADGDGAMSLMNRALEDSRRRADLGEIAEGHVGKAELMAALGQPAEAEAELLEAIDKIERIRDLQRDGEVRALTFSRFAFAYYRLASMLLEEQRHDEAFRVAERMRARVLLESLDDARASSRLVPEGDAAVRHEEVIDRVVAIQRELLGDQLSDAERELKLEELERLEAEGRALRDDMAAQSSRFASVHAPQIPDLDAVRRQLDDREAVLLFLASTDYDPVAGERGGSWVLAITRQGVRAHRLTLDESHGRRAEMFLGLIQRRDAEGRFAAARIYRDWLAPAIDPLPAAVERLIVVPDGPLHGLPIGALRERAEAPALAERFEIAVVPSVTLWHRWRTEPGKQASVPALALADPELSTGKLVPERLRQGTLAEGVHLGPLPHARREADRVVRLLGGGSELLAGVAASERALKDLDLNRFRMMHFATHAIIDDRHPERSAVLLTPGDDGEDGLLQLREVVDLDLAGQVVVLSACRSASGMQVEGEGVMGMAHAFFQAGARTVVGSLWPLRDDDAAWLAERFAQHLSRGRSVGRAMALARRDLIAEGAPPAAWAGLVVLGDADQVPVPRRSWIGYAVPPAVLLLLAAAAGVWWWRRGA
ncbi:hypothetical protein ABI59_18970 [Acidobacteria bacterium Mor1]|nr:hypothetical protein ABI59_18970 [Acidobacteria bacterium Mor1]